MSRVTHVHVYSVGATWSGGGCHGATVTCRCGRSRDIGYRGDKILGGERRFALRPGETG